MAGLYLQNGQFNSDPGEFVLQDSVVSGNSADFQIDENGRRSRGDGGGIFAKIEVEVGHGEIGPTGFVRNTISHNKASLEGGGLFVSIFENDLLAGEPTGPPFTAVQIEDSTIHHNVAYGGGPHLVSSIARGGGGLRLFSYGHAETAIANTTISGNRSLSGGGMMISAAPVVDGPRVSSVAVRHSTITGNKAGPFASNEFENIPPFSTQPQETIGGGLAVRISPSYGQSIAVEIDHSIIAGNIHAYNEPDDLSGENYGNLSFSPDLGTDELPKFYILDRGDPEPLTPFDIGYNLYTFQANYALIGDPGAHEFYNVIAIAGNYIVDDPVLGPLTNNGGPTLTHLPQVGSPAIDAGDAGFAPPPSEDQRGFGRVADGNGDTVARIDIGSVEVNGGVLPDPPCNIIGDYNRDGTVNAADYTVWRDRLGEDGTLPNEDPEVTPGQVTVEDYAVWKDHFGETCEEMGAGQAALVVAIDLGTPSTAPRVAAVVSTVVAQQPEALGPDTIPLAAPRPKLGQPGLPGSDLLTQRHHMPSALVVDEALLAWLKQNRQDDKRHVDANNRDDDSTVLTCKRDGKDVELRGFALADLYGANPSPGSG